MKRIISLLLMLAILIFPKFPTVKGQAAESKAGFLEQEEAMVCCATDSMPQKLNDTLSEEKKPSFSGDDTPYVPSFNPTTSLITNQLDSEGRMPSTGNVKLLVLPVAFPDYPEYQENYDEEKLHHSFFDDYNPDLKISEQSVRGLYQKFSFCKLNISGQVLPLVVAPETSDYYSEDTGIVVKDDTRIQKLYQEALRRYIENGEFDPSEYDSDNDGYIDGLVIKYLRPSSSGQWWPKIWSIGKNKTFGSKAINRFSHTSIKSNVDTDVHEIGHLFGLPDLYNDDSSNAIVKDLPEMMANDCPYFNPFHKILLGWIEPRILTNEPVSQIDLYAEGFSDDPLVSENQAVVFCPDPLLFPYGEYFIVEYRTGFPDDPKHKNMSFTTTPGVIIWHVDIMLDQNGTGYYPYRNLDERHKKRLNLVTKSERDRFRGEEDILLEGDVFSSDTTPNSDFYDGTYTGAYLEVESITPEKAIIKAGFRDPDLSPPPTIEFDFVKAIGRADNVMVHDFSIGTITFRQGDLLIPVEDIKSIHSYCKTSFYSENEYYSEHGEKVQEIQYVYSFAGYDIKTNPSDALVHFGILGVHPYPNGIARRIYPAGTFRYRGKYNRTAISPFVYIDNAPPEIELQGSSPQKIERGEAYTELGAEVTDNLDPDIIAGKLDGKLSIDSSQVNTAKCGTYTVTYTATDHAGNETTAEREVIVRDTIAPTATVSYSTLAPTSGDVVATITPSEPVTVTNTENGSLSYTFTENGSFTFEFEDEAGNKGAATATVSNIDKSLPTGTVSYDITNPTNQDVTATLTMDPTITILNNNGSNIYVFTENGSFEFELQNAAGTKGSVAAAVTWIDKETPTATVTYSPHKLTNQDVTAAIIPSEEVTVTNNGGSLSHTFTENGSFAFEFEDKAGNKGTVNATVDWIDKEPPAITLLGDNPLSLKLGEEYVEPGVEVTDNRDEEIESKLEIDASAVDTEKAGTYTVKYSVTDSAGNHTEVTRTVKVEKPGTPTPPTPTPPDPPQPVELPFTDVAKGAWYYDAVKFMYENGLMAGTGEDTFSPNMTTTRGMIVTILWRLEEKPQSAAAATFADVKPGSYYYDSVRWAAEQGIVKGKSAASFAPDDPITRQELAAILYRYAQLGGRGGIQNGTEILRFPDTGEVADWAKEAMTWTVDQEIISGRGNGLLAPKANSTRAEAASMLMRYCEPASAFQK